MLHSHYHKSLPTLAFRITKIRMWCNKTYLKRVCAGYYRNARMHHFHAIIQHHEAANLSWRLLTCHICLQSIFSKVLISKTLFSSRNFLGTIPVLPPLGEPCSHCQLSTAEPQVRSAIIKKIWEQEPMTLPAFRTSLLCLFYPFRNSFSLQCFKTNPLSWPLNHTEN